jgi:dipeptidyl aminopeptidase/acylaminoacyl peptidase
MNTLRDIVFAARWLKANKEIKEKRVVVSGRSFGGMTTMAQYVNFQSEFDLFTPVASISDISQFLLNDSGWWAGDDFGVKRDSSGRTTSSELAATAFATNEWNPMKNLNKLQMAKPIMAFSASSDTRVGPHQTTQFVQALQEKFGAESPVYLFEHPGGHFARAEVVEEALFIMKNFDLRDFKPVK